MRKNWALLGAEKGEKGAGGHLVPWVQALATRCHRDISSQQTHNIERMKSKNVRHEKNEDSSERSEDRAIGFLARQSGSTLKCLRLCLQGGLLIGEV